MGKSRTDSYGKDGVPNEKFIDGGFGDVALFPGDFGVENIGNDSSNSSRDESGKPEKIVVVNDNI